MTYDSKDTTEHSFKQSCVYNRISKNYHLANKKNLFLNLKKYYLALNKDPNDYIPMTYLIKKGHEDVSFKNFLLQTKHLKNICWIIKPGENTNRGRGIKLCNGFSDLINYMKRHKRRSYIVQKYINKPLLINKRKFDIRVFGLFTTINGCQKGFFFQEGYLRTASKEFTCKNISNRFIHLTNDAVQKKSENYGKYETSNKLSYLDFEKYLKSAFPNKNISFYKDIYPQIKQLVRDSFLSVYGKMDAEKGQINAFEIFGYDFMIDENFKVYLIEANTNPCLEINCTLMSSIISSLIDNTFRITLDPYFLYPFQFKDAKRHIGLCDSSTTLSKFELVFDENLEHKFLTDLKKKILNNTSTDENEEYNEVYEGNGIEEVDESPLKDEVSRIQSDPT